MKIADSVQLSSLNIEIHFIIAFNVFLKIDKKDQEKIEDHVIYTDANILDLEKRSYVHNAITCYIYRRWYSGTVEVQNKDLI